MANSMDILDIYLVKSIIWLTGFAIMFLSFLRNERYFQLNRYFLLSGIIASIILPFYTWHYTVLITSEQTPTNTILDLPTHPIVKSLPGIHILWWIYAIGICLLVIRLVWQTVNVTQKLRKTGYEVKGSVKLVRTVDYSASFSFFSYVFVNPSTSDIEATEIINHEREHIEQNHWVDLILVEILCILQWFNPFAWVYAHLIRQNHEYLADERALQHTSNPALYKVTLLNQLLDVPIIRFANFFDYSLNRKRFRMMKKSIHSPFRKLKLLIALPLIALVFYAFAKPELKAITSSGIQTGAHSLGHDVLNTNNGKIYKENTEVKQLTVSESTKHMNIHHSPVIKSVQEKNVPTKVMISDTVISSKDKKLAVGIDDLTHAVPKINAKIMPTDTTTTQPKVYFAYKKELTLIHKDYNYPTVKGYPSIPDYKIKTMIIRGDSSGNINVKKP